MNKLKAQSAVCSMRLLGHGEPKEEWALMKLPIEARRAWLKLLNIVPLFVPAIANSHEQWEIDQMAEENKLTPEEQAAFRKHFPDGFFGRIVV